MKTEYFTKTANLFKLLGLFNVFLIDFVTIIATNKTVTQLPK